MNSGLQDLCQAVRAKALKALCAKLVGATIGDAKRVFDEILQNWDRQLMGGVSPQKFKSLNQYINDAETAEDVIEDVIEMVDEIIFSKTMLKG